MLSPGSWTNSVRHQAEATFKPPMQRSDVNSLPDPHMSNDMFRSREGSCDIALHGPICMASETKRLLEGWICIAPRLWQSMHAPQSFLGACAV